MQESTVFLNNRQLELKMYGFDAVPVRDIGYQYLHQLHRHRFWQMILCCEGAAELELASHREKLEGGDIAIIPPECPHSLHFFETVKFKSFCFKFNLRAPLLPELKEVMLIRNDECTRQILTATDALYRGSFPEELRKNNLQYSVSPESSHPQLLEGLLLGILQYYCLERSAERGQGELLFRMREAVARRGGGPVTVKELAAEIGYSPGHLLLLTYRKIGKSTKQFIDEERIKIAKRYLRYSTLNVAEVAERMGFADPVYFGKFFRKLTSETPGRYLRGCRGGT